jgi:hypothetical protein
LEPTYDPDEDALNQEDNISLEELEEFTGNLVVELEEDTGDGEAGRETVEQYLDGRDLRRLEADREADLEGYEDVGYGGSGTLKIKSTIGRGKSLADVYRRGSWDGFYDPAEAARINPVTIMDGEGNVKEIAVIPQRPHEDDEFTRLQERLKALRKEWAAL